MKSLLSLLLFSCFPCGIICVVVGIENFLIWGEYEELLFTVLGLFLISIFIPLKTQYKKLSWNDDFFYLFFMTFSKKRIRKHRSLKQKMREELQDEFKN